MSVSWVGPTSFKVAQQSSGSEVASFDRLGQFLSIPSGAPSQTIMAPMFWDGSVVLKAIWYKIQVCYQGILGANGTATADINMGIWLYGHPSTHPSDGQEDAYMTYGSDVPSLTWEIPVEVSFEVRPGESQRSYCGYWAIDLDEDQRSVRGTEDEAHPFVPDAAWDQVIPWMTINNISNGVDVKVFGLGLQWGSF